MGQLSLPTTLDRASKLARLSRGRSDGATPVDGGATWVTDYELAVAPQPVVVPDGPDGPYRTARLLVRLQAEPLGMVNLSVTGTEISADEIQRALARRFGPSLEAKLGPDWPTLLQDGLPPLSTEMAELARGELPPVSVVIGTRNRTHHAVTCVQHVLKQAYPAPIEVVVVDNAPSNDATRVAIATQFGDDDRVRYVHESRPGLSRARNRGLAVARYGRCAFLSDDIVVDPTWLLALARAFVRNPGVACAVGYCPPLYLDTPEQRFFEQTMAWGWRNGFDPQVVLPNDPTDKLHPFRVSFGNGANICFDTEALRSLGGFDESLGPGTLARGGEDLDAPVRILLAGHALAYEPAALGWHADRYDDRGYTTHMFTYGAGLTAFLTKHLFSRATRGMVLRRIPHGIGYLFQPAILPRSEDRFDGLQAPRLFGLYNAAGRLAGPLLYVRSWRALRRQT